MIMDLHVVGPWYDEVCMEEGLLDQNMTPMNIRFASQKAFINKFVWVTISKNESLMFIVHIILERYWVHFGAGISGDLSNLENRHLRSIESLFLASMDRISI